MRFWNRRDSFIVLAVAAFCFPGCSRGPELGEVEGTVTLNGKPLEGLRVQFLPDPDQGTKGPMSSGFTDAAGHFRLVCQDNRPGAVIGHHRVSVLDTQAGSRRKLPLDRRDELKLTKEELEIVNRPARTPRRYADPAGRLLLKEVRQGQQTIDLSLTGQPDKR